MNAPPTAQVVAANRPAQARAAGGGVAALAAGAAAATGRGVSCGVVLFDDPSDPRDGWASANGGEARRVKGVHELQTGTVWLSNLTYSQFFSDTEAWRNTWLRHDAYLGVAPKAMLVEWGYDPQSSPPNFVASLCSTLFHRILSIAARLLREHDPLARFPDAFQGKTLRHDLARLLPPAEFPKGEAASIIKNGQAFNFFTATVMRGAKGSRPIMLRAPRIAHASDMLTAPLPKGPFEFVSRSQIRDRPDVIGGDRVAWARGFERPLLLEIQVEHADPEASAVFGFGIATDRNRRIPRSWVAHPEFLAMSEFSRIDIKNVYMGSGYAVLAQQLSEPVRRFLSDRFCEASWSAGVVAETIWRAAALGEAALSSGRRPTGPHEERPESSWRGAWLSSNDKCAMFAPAMQLARMGYDIGSYGLGWVMARATEEQIPDLVRDGLTVGLVPRFADVPANLFAGNAPVPWQGDRRARMVATLTVKRSQKELWQLDRLPLLDREQQELHVKRMKAQSQS